MSSGRTNLITGATGFAGCYLTRALLRHGERVVGLSRGGRWPTPWREPDGPAELLPCDVADAPALARVLERVQPTHVYHLAGYASAGRSFREPDAAWEGNLTATRRLCEALRSWGGKARLLWVGSGLVYGQPADPSRPVDEDAPLRPDTPYAASKAAADLAAFMYTRTDGLDVVRARPFNHTGPHQSAEFAIPNFARQLVGIERGELPPVLEVGDLTPHRDLTDVRDMVAAYRLLMDHGRTGEAYNIGSGVSTPMAAVLDRLVALTGLKVEVRTRADLLRPAEQAIVQVDAGKLRRETGWRPAFTLEQTLMDTLAAWRGSGAER